jgi:hypothetical protein
VIFNVSVPPSLICCTRIGKHIAVTHPVSYFIQPIGYLTVCNYARETGELRNEECKQGSLNSQMINARVNVRSDSQCEDASGDRVTDDMLDN